MADRPFETFSDQIDELNRIALFWMTGNRSLSLAKTFVSYLQDLTEMGIVDYDVEPIDAMIEILDFMMITIECGH